MEYPVPTMEAPASLDRHTVNAMFTELAMDHASDTVEIEDPEVVAPAATYSLDDLDDLDEDTDALYAESYATVPEPAPSLIPEPAYAEAQPAGQYDPRIVSPELEPALANGSGHAEGADMAALLRELSSLGGGFDSEPGSASGNSAVVGRPVGTAASGEKNAKKKKGFFGR
jgi:hypothetical protein